MQLDVDTFKWIIGAMGVAVLSLAGYVVVLHGKIEKLYEDRIKSLDDKLQLISLLKGDRP